MKAFLTSIAVSLAFVSVSLGAEISPEALEAMKSFAMKQQTALSTLRSFDMSGTIKIVVSDDYAKASISPGPKIGQRRFRIIASGEGLKETLETLDEAGKVTRTEVYYLNQKRVIWADNSNGHYFTIKPFDLAERKSNGLFNICPAFFENSFLNLDITDAGIPALLVADLGSNDRWTKVVQSLQRAQIGSDDHVYATLAGTEGHSTIELVKSPNSTNGYRVASLSFFSEVAKDVTMERKIEVLDVSNENNFGNVGKIFKMNIYDPPSRVPSITWEYAIVEMKANCPIDAEALQFDPRAVTNIKDAEKGCYIVAAK